jgi:hypothetical protein
MKNAYKILVVKPERKRHSEDLGVGRRIILKLSYGNGFECVDLVHLDQDRDRWRVLVNTVMNLRVP